MLHLRLLCMGQRMPSWVESGYREYAKRMAAFCQWDCTELPLAGRASGGSAARARTLEGERIRTALRPRERLVTLDIEGRAWTTAQLASRIEAWEGDGQPRVFVIGGPEGLDASITALASERWSLSQLTLPHPMVRILVTEQLYRGYSMLRNHPYHR